VLGELRSMSIALPGSRNLFGQLQKAFFDSKGGRVTLKRGVHQALDDFRWIANDLASRPTRIAELVPLTPVAEGHHDMPLAKGQVESGFLARAWFPGPVWIQQSPWYGGWNGHWMFPQILFPVTIPMAPSQIQILS